jgi:anti-sigma factor RsiW
MKPCKQNAQAITDLALGSLNDSAANRLREHLQDCAGCRHYLAQISQVTDALANTPLRTDIQSSELFHRKLLSRLQTEDRFSFWHSFRDFLLRPRFAIAVAGTVAVIALLTFWPSPAKPQAHVQIPTTNDAGKTADLDPSVANYKNLLNRSPEELDDLIARQATQDRSSVPIYRASTLFADAAFD